MNNCIVVVGICYSNKTKCCANIVVAHAL